MTRPTRSRASSASWDSGRTRARASAPAPPRPSQISEAPGCPGGSPEPSAPGAGDGPDTVPSSGLPRPARAALATGSSVPRGTAIRKPPPNHAPATDRSVDRRSQTLRSNATENVAFRNTRHSFATARNGPPQRMPDLQGFLRTGKGRALWQKTVLSGGFLSVVFR